MWALQIVADGVEDDAAEAAETEKPLLARTAMVAMWISATDPDIRLAFPLAVYYSTSATPTQTNQFLFEGIGLLAKHGIRVTFLLL